MAEQIRTDHPFDGRETKQLPYARHHVTFVGRPRAVQKGGGAQADNRAYRVDPDNPWPLIGVSALMLAYEWLGGLHAIAWTDALQGCFMLISCVTLPSYVSTEFISRR